MEELLRELLEEALKEEAVIIPVIEEIHKGILKKIGKNTVRTPG